jgi:hypothetical protein
MRDIIRRNGELPIYLWWDEEASEYVDQAIYGMKRVLKEGVDVSTLFPIRRVGIGWMEGNFGSVEWYFKRARKKRGDYGLQYQASDVLRLCAREPYQRAEPHVEVGITGRDLFDDGMEFVYGVTWGFERDSYEEMGKIVGMVISCKRIGVWYGGRSPFVFRHMIMHETSHFFGVPSRTHGVEYSLGRHCVRGDCAVGQVNMRRYVEEDGKEVFIDALEAARRTARRLERTGSVFCEHCLNDLIRGKVYVVRELFGVDLTP